MTQDTTAPAGQAAPLPRRRSHLRPFRDEGRLRVLRFWLSVAFMAGAATGMALWWADGCRQWAVYVLMASCACKFIELTLRLLKL